MVVVAVAGLAGWSYAAAATFVVDLPLAYILGGFPFTLVATILLRPVAATTGGLVVTVVLLAVGHTVAPEVPREGVQPLVVLTAP